MSPAFLAGWGSAGQTASKSSAEVGLAGLERNKKSSREAFKASTASPGRSAGAGWMSGVAGSALSFAVD